MYIFSIISIIYMYIFTLKHVLKFTLELNSQTQLNLLLLYYMF